MQHDRECQRHGHRTECKKSTRSAQERSEQEGPLGHQSDSLQERPGSRLDIVHSPQERRGRRLEQIVARRPPSQSAARQVHAERPLHLTGQLNEPKGAIDEKRRDHASGDQIKPAEAIGKMRDAPEDAQAGGRPDQRAERRGAVESRRRANGRRLGRRRFGIIQPGQSRHPTRSVNLLCPDRKTSSRRLRHRHELDECQHQKHQSQRDERALQEWHSSTDKEPRQFERDQQKSQKRNRRAKPPDGPAEEDRASQESASTVTASKRSIVRSILWRRSKVSLSRRNVG